MGGGELKDGAMPVQVEKRMGVLEGGLASQAKHAEGSMSEIRVQAKGARIARLDARSFTEGALCISKGLIRN